jgi:hypothetical protein
MFTVTRTDLINDLDGSGAQETITFGWTVSATRLT